MKKNIFGFFSDSKAKYGNKAALVVDEIEYTYNDLYSGVKKVRLALSNYEQSRIGIFGARSLTCYEGILGTLASGKTYVPLNPKFPAERNKTIIDLAELEIFIVDRDGLKQMISIAESLKEETVFICPNIEDKDIPEPLKSYVHPFDPEPTDTPKSAEVENNHPAYIMFTSGSTGIPKGVPVSHGNVLSYVNYMKERYEINSDDKFTQTFDLTFDLSVHDMFLSWAVAASLHVIPEKVLMAPAKYIKEHKITVWFSVPSLAQFMNRFRMLKESSLPSLRYSLFCGEALPTSIAVAWRKAAPDSIVENIYGPTEATIGISHYKIPKNENDILDHNGIVSIGEIFSTQDYCLINEQGAITKEIGELCLSGSQLISGYFNNPNKTAESFFTFPEDDKLWYKTGDIVKLTNNNLFYLSRKDFQVKVRGYRIELEEINLKIKTFSNCDLVYTIPYPLSNGVSESLFSFVDNNCKTDKELILKHLRENLPEYMIPKDIIYIDEFPLNSNGKVDLKELLTKIS